MSTIRQFNWLGQARIDLPHLRSLESSIAADFDLLAGRIMAGNTGLVVRGFTITNTTSGQLPSALKLRVADGVLLHPEASESGSVFFVPTGTPDESLNSTNAKVAGGFVSGVTNYVGLDLVRSADDSTADLVKFHDADTGTEIPKVVPLARTLGYRIIISTVDFSLQPNVLPIAKVVVDATNKVTSVTDARQMMFRLGSGGNVPNRQNSYFWQSRLEDTSSDVFAGGDKQIFSLKGWMDAAMTRIWEIGGGQYWYSPCSDRDVKLLMTGPAMANNEHFTWDLGTEKLTWQGLVLVFGNSEQATYNEIADNAVEGVVMDDGECLYVDIDRSKNRKAADNDALVPTVYALTSLGSGSPPGSRWVIAWRKGDEVFVRDSQFSVGTVMKSATTTGLGTVILNADASDNGGDDANPKVAIVNDSGLVIGAGITNDAALAAPAPITVGAGANDSQVTIGKEGVEVRIKNIKFPSDNDLAMDFGVWRFEQTLNEYLISRNDVPSIILGGGTNYRKIELKSPNQSVGLGFSSDQSYLKGIVGTTTNHPLTFMSNNYLRWEIAADGTFQAIDENRKIANVLDPVLAQDAATKNYVDTILPPAVLQFYASAVPSVPASQAFRYMWPGFVNSESPSDEYFMIVPYAGVISKLYVVNTKGAGTFSAGGYLTFTVKKNGALTTLEATRNTAWTQNVAIYDTTHSFTVAAGDRISVYINVFKTDTAPQGLALSMALTKA